MQPLAQISHEHTPTQNLAHDLQQKQLRQQQRVNMQQLQEEQHRHRVLESRLADALAHVKALGDRFPLG